MRSNKRLCTVRPAAALAAALSLAGAASAGEPPVDPVPCDVLIRYDDGTDDFRGIGRVIGGTNDESHGILASPPASAQRWLVQSAGFFADFWQTPGVVTFTIQDRAVPALTASEPVFIDSGGVWEVEFSNPVCVVGDFDVLLCPDADVQGVSGEDVADVDLRSFHQPFVCQNVELLHNMDLMIWACVTPCDPVPVEPQSWGSIKNRYE